MGSRGVWNGETATVAALLALVCLHPTTVVAAGVVGSGTAQSCTETLLDAALAGGGMVTFDCGTNPVTIMLSTEKVITSETTVDGGGTVTLSGGNAVRVFGVAEGVTFNVQNLTITNGAASAEGGGISNFGTLTVINSTLADNGGTGIATSGTLTVVDSTFARNGIHLSLLPRQAGPDGGGILVFDGTATVTNCTFADNASGRGGAIYSQGTVTVSNSTFSRNSGFGSGGAIYAQSGSLTVINCIIYSVGGNCDGDITDGGHNLQWPGTDCGETIRSVDPQLDPSGLKDNGGPTQTIALLPDSPAINAGDPEVCTNPPVNGVDQRGYARPGEGATSCSIGAFEYNSSGPPLATATATATGTPSVTPTPTSTPVPSVTPSASPSVTATATRTVTRTPTASATSSPSGTATTRPNGGGDGGCTVTPSHSTGAAWWLLVPAVVLAWAQRRKRV